MDNNHPRFVSIIISLIPCIAWADRWGMYDEHGTGSNYSPMLGFLALLGIAAAFFIGPKRLRVFLAAWLIPPIVAAFVFALLNINVAAIVGVGIISFFLSLIYLERLCARFHCDGAKK